MGIVERIHELSDRNHADLAAARRKEKADIERATRDKSYLAEHYWQPRHTLERHRKALDTLLEIIEEENRNAPT